MGTSDDHPGVRISLEDIYREVRQTRDLVTVLATKQEAGHQAREDQERRIRNLEGKRFDFKSALNLCIAAIGVFVMYVVSR